MATRRLTIEITGDASGAKKALGDVEQSADQAGGRLAKIGSKISPGMVAAAGAVAAGAAIMLKGAYEAAAESQKIARETERVVESTGAAAWTSAGQIGDLAESISELTGADDEMVQSGANLLLTFTNVKNAVGEGNDVFDQATGLALDMATALGTDMNSAAIQLGKALNDPIRGITALGRAGVSFSDEQKAAIRTMVETGDVLGAQKVILGELSKEFGGAAEAAKTPMDELRVRIGNLQEDIGARLVPVVDKAATALGGIMDAWDGLGEGGQNAVLAITGVTTVAGTGFVAAAKLAEAYGNVQASLKRMADSGSNLAGLSSQFVSLTTKAVGFVAVVGAVGMALKKVGDSKFDLDVSKLFEGDDGQVNKVADAIGRLREEADRADTPFWDLGKAANSLGWTVSDSVGGSAEGATASLKNLDSQLATLAAGNPDAAKAQFDALAAALADNGVSAEDLASYLPMASAAISGAGGAAAAATPGVAGLAREQQNSAVAAQNQAQGIRDARDEMLASVNPYFGAIKAQQDLTAAQKTYNDAVKEHGEKSPEAINAYLGMAQAGFGLKGSLLELSAAQAGGTASADEMQRQMQSLAAYGIDVTSQSAGAATWMLGLMGGKADEVGKKEVLVPVSAPGAEDATNKIENLASAIGRVTGKVVELNAVGGVSGVVNAGLPGHAIGGTVDNGFFTVGERGPELGYKQGSRVRIFSRDDSRRMVASTSSLAASERRAPAGDVNVYVTQSDASPYEIGREVLWNMRVAG